MVVGDGNDLLALLMFVARVPDAIAPFLATVLVPSPCSTRRSSFFSSERCPTLAMNACWSDPSSAHLANARSCTCSLRIIPSARESGKILSFHYRARGLSYDSTPFFLPAGAVWPPVAVCHAVLCLAQWRRYWRAEASQAHHATPYALQRAESLCRTDPQALLCRLRARGHASPTAASGATRPDAPDQPPPTSGRRFPALLSASHLCVSGLGRSCEPA